MNTEIWDGFKLPNCDIVDTLRAQLTEAQFQQFLLLIRGTVADVVFAVLDEIASETMGKNGPLPPSRAVLLERISEASERAAQIGEACPLDGWRE